MSARAARALRRSTLQARPIQCGSENDDTDASDAVAMATHPADLAASAAIGQPPASGAASGEITDSVAAALTASSATDIDVFEIEDFSVVSPWERFIRQCEEQFVRWNIHNQATGTSADTDTDTEADTGSESESGKAPGATCVKSIELSLNDRHYTLAFHRYNIHRADTGTDWSTSTSTSTTTDLGMPHRLSHYLSSSHCRYHSLVKWLGLPSFLTLTPSNDRRIPRSEAATLLSALSIASNNSHSGLPVLVSVNDSSKHEYIGASHRVTFNASERECVSVRFDVRTCNSVPVAIWHLTGLIDFTKNHIRQLKQEATDSGLVTDTAIHAESEAETATDSTDASDSKLSIAASFSFIQSSIDATRQAQSQPQPLSLFVEEPEACTWRDVSLDRNVSLGVMWGPMTDPLTELTLTTAWPFFPEHAFVENSLYSDLEPVHAPEWRIECQWAHAQHSEWSNSAPLTQAVLTMFELARQGAKLSSLHTVIGTHSNASIDNVTLSQLSNAYQQANLSALYGETPSAEGVDAAIKRVMDIDEREKERKTPANTNRPMHIHADSENDCESDIAIASDSDRGPVPFGSLLSLFVAALLETDHHSLLTVRTVALYWLELVNELRYHFETGLDIPHLAGTHSLNDSPDYSRCLLHQKIQLLQKCIKVARERKQWQHSERRGVASASHIETEAKRRKREAENDGWEWFDRPISVDSTDNHSSSMEEVTDSDEEDDANGVVEAGAEPVGDVALFGSAHLLLHPDRPLRVPLTQPPPALTSDDFDREQELYARLIDDIEAQRLRGEVHLSSLRSDMSAFKAANPGCVFEDFVRWHSPRDWKPSTASESESARGELSMRMKQRTNQWHRQWRLAVPLAAFDQSPLWNPSELGEKLLNELEHYDCPALFTQVKLIALGHWSQSLRRTPAAISGIASIAEMIADTANHVRSAVDSAPSLSQYSLSLAEAESLANVETQCARATSLLYAFPSSTNLVTSLMMRGAATVHSNTERSDAMQVFASHSKDGQSLALPKPDRREFTVFVPHGFRRSQRGSRVYLSVLDARVPPQQPQPAQTGFIAPNSAAATARSTGATSTSNVAEPVTPTFTVSDSGLRSSRSVISRARKLRDTAALTARRWQQRATAFDSDRPQPNVRLATAFISYLPTAAP